MSKSVLVFCLLVITQVNQIIQQSLCGFFCPQYPVVEHLDLKRYLGRWNEIYKSSDCLLLESGKCGSDTLYELPDQNTAHVVFQEFGLTGQKTEATQTLSCPNQDGNCFAKFKFFLPAGDYKLIDTDYDNYAIVYSCINLGFKKYQLLWVMGRDLTLSDEILAKVEQKVSPMGFSLTSNNMIKEDNTGC